MNHGKNQRKQRVIIILPLKDPPSYQYGLDGGRKIGSEAEAAAFGELALSSESSIAIFLYLGGLKTEHNGNS